MSDASALFELLASDHRRQLLMVLCETDSVRIPEGLLTRGGTQTSAIGAIQESGHEQSDVRYTPTEREALEVDLVHCHLPKLEDADVIEWDRESQTVTRGPAFAEVEPFLLVLARNADKLPNELSYE